MKTKVVKRFIIIIGSIPGFIAIFSAITAKNIIESSNVGIISKFSKYIPEVQNLNDSSSMLNLAIVLSKYSHWIITLGIIWVFIFGFLWEFNKEEQNERNKER